MNWSICIKNEGYAASLQARKLYRLLDDERAQKLGMLRIVDESGESYLYPQDMFYPIQLSPALEQQLTAV